MPEENASVSSGKKAKKYFFIFDNIGTIEVGKNADMVMFKNKLLTCSEDEIYVCNEIFMTMVQGKVIYSI